ncbi:MAG: arginine--tRNA ligase [Candidatus Margulisbacteria bacterium]|nr:arginine--tRNA ligase [Candidatus Margulisiibacteriota bacterium]
MAKTKISSILGSVLAALGIQADLEFRVDIPPRQELGDYASNIAIIYGRKLKQNPLKLAEQISKKVTELDKEKLVSKVEFVKPGFVNIFLNNSFLQQTTQDILQLDHAWGTSQAGNQERVLLEFVSANPTGPLHVGHGRWAVVGDVIARLLKATGSKVKTEFYVNDVGNQVEKLEASVKARRQNIEIPAGGYGGEYIKEVEGETRAEMLAFLMDQQKSVLKALSVEFDTWFAESELHKQDKIRWAIEKLHGLGVTFEESGAIWFKSQALGDDKNRVLMREDGRPTYFAADIAYHLNKFERGFDHLIDIWGTDHHGYLGRLTAALKVLGLPVEKFEIIIGQLVTLYRGNEPVRMSKRTGEMITLQEVIDEIGADAVRFFFSATDVNSHLDFDLELAKKKSQDNPVYYVQYAHARICSILKKSEMRNAKSEQGIDLSELNHPAERALMFKLLTWPDLVVEAARLRHPHRITEYGKELATVFHSFYEQCRVLGNPARLALVNASRITLRNVLKLLGINAPEAM